MIEFLFPTPVYFNNNDSFIGSCNCFFDENIQKFNKTTEGFLSTLENYNPKKANLDLDVASTECGQNLSTFIISCAEEFIKLRKLKPAKVEIANMWLNQMDGDGFQYHKPHSHYGYVFSGTYYVNSPIGSSGLTFFNQARQDFYFHLPQEEYTPENSNTWTFPTNNGDIIIFPSNLVHGVNPSFFEGTRRSVAFDLNILQ